MGLFALALARARLGGAKWARNNAFQALVLVYAVQRFLWEFVKPYPPVAGPFNLFHILTLGMGIYAVIWWRYSGNEQGVGERA